MDSSDFDPKSTSGPLSESSFASIENPSFGQRVLLNGVLGSTLGSLKRDGSLSGNPARFFGVNRGEGDEKCRKLGHRFGVDEVSKSHRKS